jgi:hypothetical protein
MKLRLPLAAAVCGALLNFNARAATTHYVDVNCTNPISPYLSWVTAATNIQQAANIVSGGDTVLVTNGVYQYGGASGTRVNVAFNNVTVKSVNGPALTIIKGAWDIATNGPSALRCVSLSAGSVLSGFTLTNGATTVSGLNSGGGVYCAAANALVTNCVIVGNSAYNSGGGVYSGTLINCSLIGNAAYAAGGGGGGANNSVLINCLLARNFSGYSSGGAGLSTLINCTVVSNVAAEYAGAGWDSTFKNSVVYYNHSYYTSADDSGGYGNWTNCCIPFAVTFGANNFTNPPLFANLAAGDYHLDAASTSINAGNNSFVTNNTDLDGNPRSVGGTVDLGAYEFQSPILHVNISNTTPVSPFTNWITAATNIQDAVDAANAGDFIVVSNGVYQTGGRAVYGMATNRVTVDKAVTVQSVNGAASTIIAGSFIHGGVVMRCLYLTNGAVLSGFTLTNGGLYSLGDFQREQSGGGAWCEDPSAIISNCVLSGNNAVRFGGGAFGGTLFNCVLTNNATAYGGGSASNTLINCTLTHNTSALQNLNYGGGAYGCTLSNCLIVGNQSLGGGGYGAGAAFSTLLNCIVSNNAAGGSGGGVYFGIANNSLISSNRASSGGGAYSIILNNCVLKNNFANGNGGGAYNSTLDNCTVISNKAAFAPAAVAGGGIYGGGATNCILCYNSADNGSNFYFPGNAAINYCCTTPFPTNGVGNITNEPAFADLANGDFHLQSNSACINSGNNSYVTGSTDLDGNPRVVGGTVDIGAYEYQTPTSIISYAWLQQYGLPTDGSVDHADLDGASFNVYQDWIAGLDPTNALSVLAMLQPVLTNSPAGLVVSWESVTNRTYFLQRSTNLGVQPAFSTIQSDIVGQIGTTSYTDTNAVGNGPFFYRVGVQ